MVTATPATNTTFPLHLFPQTYVYDAAYGPHTAAVAARLHAGGLSCKVLDRPAFTRAMLEKLIWIW
jgi:hypothetical protein